MARTPYIRHVLINAGPSMTLPGQIIFERSSGHVTDLRLSVCLITMKGRIIFASTYIAPDFFCIYCSVVHGFFVRIGLCRATVLNVCLGKRVCCELRTSVRNVFRKLQEDDSRMNRN